MAKETIDPNHELVHKVDQHIFDRYMSYLQDTLTSNCGKEWAPDRTGMDLNKPKCPVCFPKRPSRAWAA